LTAAHADAGASTPDQGRMPPVTEIGAASMVFVACGVIYLASYLPRRAPLWLAVVFLAAAALLLLTNVVLLARLKDFAWGRFFQVSRWALLAYLVIAGMIEYAFIVDDTPGPQLAALSAGLALFAVDVPLLLGFSVARHQKAPG
jgi:hypothetical protein